MAAATHEFRGSVDFNQHELRNAVFQNLITPPIGPKQGQIYFNSSTGLQSPFYWNSTEWMPFGLKPVHKRYLNEAAMLADQLWQIRYYLYYLETEDIYYEYTGLTTASIDDYNIIGGNGALRVKQNIPTGHIIGMQISINAGDNTKFDIAPGAYAINTFTDITDIKVQVVIYPGATGITPTYLATDPASYIAIDENQNIIQSASPFSNMDRRIYAILGAAIHTNNVNINVVNEIKAPVAVPTNQLHDFIKAVGPLNLVGNVYGAGTTGLRVSKSAGTVWGLGINAQDFGNQHQLDIPGNIDLTFRYRLRDSTEFADTLVINPNQYDNAGVLTTVPNNRYTVQRFNLFQSGLTRVQYGQNIYANFEDAKLFASTETFEVEKNIADNAIFRAYLVVKKGITDLAAAIAADEATFIPVDKFGNVVSGAGSSITYDVIVGALGYVPENVANKATNFSVLNNILYPTTQAVANYVAANAYTHPAYTPVSQTLNGATVLASFSSDAIGSVTGFTTRTLTPANIGAEPSFSKGNLVQGNAMSLTGTLTSRLVGTGDITIAHADTSSQANVSNTLGNVIQSISVDTYGHVTVLSSINLDTRYYTETEVNALLNNYQLLSEKGVALGYVPLDASGKIPTAYIPDSILGQVTYIGTWNASTNTPTLPDPTTVKGDYYIVTTVGTYLGTDYQIGDWVISDGIAWTKVDNSDSVTSVFGRTGNVVAIEADYQAFYPRLSQSYNNPTWINTLAWSKITGTPTTLAGYGITDAVPSNRTLTINGIAFDLTANRSWSVGTVTSVALSLPSIFSVSGSPITTSGTLTATLASQSANTVFAAPNGSAGAPSFRALVAADIPLLPITTEVSAGNWKVFYSNGTGVITELTVGAANTFLKGNGVTSAPTFATITGSEITGAALTKTDDTNVTLTLGGTPATALLRAASLTLGWTGQLAVSRGGTGASTLTGVLIGNGTSAVSAVTGTASQLLRRNAGNTAYEFFTHDFINIAGARTAISLTTTGTSGLATYNSGTGVFNIPNYNLSGLGGVPLTRQITVQGETFDLSADRVFPLITVGAGLLMPPGYQIQLGDVISGSSRYVGINNFTEDNFGFLGSVWDTPSSLFYMEFRKGDIGNAGGFFGEVYDYLTNLGAGFSIDKNPSADEYQMKFVKFAPLGTQEFVMTYDNTIKLVDNQNNRGIENNGDYELNFNARTLVTKQYVDGLILSTSVPLTRTLTINGIAQDLSTNRTWSVGTVTSVAMSTPTGLTVTGSPITTSGTLALTFTAGYSIPTTAKQTQWDTAYTNRITSLTTTGNSGAATLISNVLNVPNYTLAGLGGIGGTIASGQVAFGTGANTIGGDANFTWSGSILRVAGNTPWLQLDDLDNTTTFNLLSNGGFFYISPNSGSASNSLLRIYATGNTGVGLNFVPTDTLDVNGTARIRTIANVVSTEVLVPSATGVINKRTLTEFKSDLGLANGITGTGVAGQVAFFNGIGSITGNSELLFSSVNNGSLTFTSLGNPYQITLFTSSNSNTSRGRIGDYLENTYIEFYNASLGNMRIVNKQGTTSFGNILFETGSTPIERWRITYVGTLLSNGAQTIQTSTGNLSLLTGGGNGNIILTPNGTGITSTNRPIFLNTDTLYNAEATSNISIESSSTNGTPRLLIGADNTNNISYIQSMQRGIGWVKNLILQGMGGNVLIGNFLVAGMPTSTLDVNGTVRVRTIANAASTEVLVPSATGVINKRTLTEFKGDLGLTNGITGTGVSGQVSYWNGTTTQTGSDNFTFASNNLILGTNSTLSTRHEFHLYGSTGGLIRLYSGATNEGIIYADPNKLVIRHLGTDSLDFWTTGAHKWSMLSSGILQSVGAQTIQTSSGVLSLQPSGVITTGINATANLNLYSTGGAGVIRNTVSSGAIQIAGSNTVGDGANIVMYGSTHATRPDKLDLRTGGTIQTTIDSSVVDIPTNYLQARGGITNTSLVSSPLVTGPILTYTLTNGGSGYVDGTYTNVALTTVSDQHGALFDVTVSGGIVTVATLKHAGRRYVPGSTHTIVNTLLGGTGSGLVITIDTVQGSDVYLAKSTGSTIRLEAADATMVSNQLIGQILFSQLDTSVFSDGDRAAIVARTLGASAGGGYIDFEASSATATATSANRVVSMRVLDNSVRFQDGTALIPSISFLSDINTGLYWISADTMGIATGGTLRQTISNVGTTLNTLSAATTDTDRFLVSDSGLIKYRTGSQVLSDIGGISGTGTTNYLSKFTGAGTIGDSAVFENGGNVGIGTTTVTDKLNVAGGILVTATSAFSSGIGARFYKQAEHGTVIQASGGSTNDFALITPTGGLKMIIAAGQNEIVFNPFDGAGIAIGNIVPTEKIDTDGTARLRGIASGTGDVVVVDSNGVLKKSDPLMAWGFQDPELETPSDVTFSNLTVTGHWFRTGNIVIYHYYMAWTSAVVNVSSQVTLTLPLDALPVGETGFYSAGMSSVLAMGFNFDAGHTYTGMQADTTTTMRLCSSGTGIGTIDFMQWGQLTGGNGQLRGTIMLGLTSP